MSDTDFPTFTDGRRSPRQPIVKCWNILEDALPKRYHWLKDDIKVSGMALDHVIETTGEHVGGFSGASARKGTLTLLLDSADDSYPLPGHIVSIQKGAVLGWYRVDDASAPNDGKQQVTVALTVTRIIHPFFSDLLSEDEGEVSRQTFSIAAISVTTTITPDPVNHRTGSTKLYELTPEGETASLPAGVAIASSTGVITLTAASLVAGTYYLDVTAKDTLAPKRTLKGGNHLVLTITA
jgi:hypothetical protein